MLYEEHKIIMGGKIDYNVKLFSQEFRVDNVACIGFSGIEMLFDVIKFTLIGIDKQTIRITAMSKSYIQMTMT